jgi:hypothetical protein
MHPLERVAQSLIHNGRCILYQPAILAVNAYCDRAKLLDWPGSAVETKREMARFCGMSNKQDPHSDNSNAEKDPSEWTTGAETMTGAQASYLKTLCQEAGEPFDPSLSKADASKRIDELQAATGRGKSH